MKRTLILLIVLSLLAVPIDAKKMINQTTILVSLIPGQRFDISTAEDGVPFDLVGDGKKSPMAWPVDVENVGFLYYDEPVYGHTGKNLFGNINGRENGFKQLGAMCDDSQVNKVNSPDSRIIGPPDGFINKEDHGCWKHLGVWRDLNRNGLKDPGELKTLDELGIETLEFTYTANQRQEGDGNQIQRVARYFKKGDSQPYFMADYIAKVVEIK